MYRKLIRLIAMSLLIVLTLVVLLIPDHCWPIQWVSYRWAQGDFDGQPVMISIPKSINRDVLPFEYNIKMANTSCRISRVDSSGQIIPFVSLQDGYAEREKLLACEQLRLDPGLGMGEYSIGVGLKWHWRSPFLWRVWAWGMFIGFTLAFIVAVFFNRSGKGWQKKLKSAFKPWQWAIMLVALFFSCAVLYPALHELGHALTGMALGGRINNIVFTPFSGDKPHVAFQYLSKEANPWMQAGGVFLPIIFTYLLLIVWIMFRQRLSRFGHALFLIPCVSMVLFPSFSFDDHLKGLALLMGFTHQAGILLVNSIPLLLGFLWLAIVYKLSGWNK